MQYTQVGFNVLLLAIKLGDVHAMHVQTYERTKKS